MRRPRLLPLAAVLPLFAVGPVAWAQPAPAAVCAPIVELGESIPPRVAQRLRRVLDHAVGSLPRAAPCAPSHARLDWNDHELTVHIALDDGRIAVRNLESLEDVLPTLLSVLAVPAPDPAAPDPAAPDAPPSAAPVTPTAVAVPVVAASPLPTPVPVSAGSRPSGSGWSLLVSAAVGVSFQDGDSALGRLGGEVGAATPRIALSARTSLAWSLGEHRRGDFANAISPRPPSDRTESSLVLSGRARLGSGRLRAEVGGFGGVAHNVASTDTEWLPRVGVEASLGWPVARSITLFVRTEGHLDLGSGLGPGVGLTLGATWEPQR